MFQKGYSNPVEQLSRLYRVLYKFFILLSLLERFMCVSKQHINNTQTHTHIRTLNFSMKYQLKGDKHHHFVKITAILTQQDRADYLWHRITKKVLQKQWEEITIEMTMKHLKVDKSCIYLSNNIQVLNITLITFHTSRNIAIYVCSL